MIVILGAITPRVTSACCNLMHRVVVTCGYSAERGYIVSK